MVRAFFDLGFVVVISELTHLPSANISLEWLGNYIRLLPKLHLSTKIVIFVSAWWIWIDATYYNDRFETGGLENRPFIFLLMLPAAGLAIFAHHIPGNFSIGYGAHLWLSHQRSSFSP